MRKERSPLYPSVLSQAMTPSDGHVHTDGVIYMNTWKNICTCICLIQPVHQCRKNVLLRIYLRTKVCPVMEKSADDQADRHAGKQADTQLIILFPAGKEKVSDPHRHIGKPQKVRHHKIFAERNIIIQRHMHHMIVGPYRLFQITKPHKINQLPYAKIQACLYFRKSCFIITSPFSLPWETKNPVFQWFHSK